MISLYIEKDVILNDLKNAKTLIDALSAFEKLSSDIVINILMNHTNENIEEIDQFFHYNMIPENFTELYNSFEFITKDEVYISFNTDNLYKWDRNRGKSILILTHQNSHDFLLEFNKIFLTNSAETNLKKLRMYIHI